MQSHTVQCRVEHWPRHTLWGDDGSREVCAFSSCCLCHVSFLYPSPPPREVYFSTYTAGHCGTGTESCCVTGRHPGGTCLCDHGDPWRTTLCHAEPASSKKTQVPISPSATLLSLTTQYFCADGHTRTCILYGISRETEPAREYAHIRVEIQAQIQIKIQRDLLQGIGPHNYGV